MKTPNIAQMRFQLQNKPVHLAIGGQGPKNWMKDSIEPVLDPLKIRRGIMSPEQIAKQRQSMDTARRILGNEAPRATLEQMERELQQAHQGNALNNWIQGNLTNYIRKQMATHDDPIRKLAEQGIVHIPSEQVGLNRYKANAHRATHGAERLGESEEAKAWEDAADVAMEPMYIRNLHPDYREPWMEKADPKTQIFTPTNDMHAHYLGFDHMVDVLKQDLAEGRIRPEQLSKISMEQAVRRVHQYDQERKKAMADAALKATEGMPVHKEYPEGYKWIEIAPRPIDENQPLPEGYSWKEPKAGAERLQGPERVYLGHTKTEALKAAHQRDRNLVESREKPVRDALKYEGDTMGHCVGGYPDKVMRGESRIFSLRDAKNEPHVTIEVNPKSVQEGIRNLPDAERYALAQEVKDQYFNGVMPGTRDEDKYFDLIDKHYVAKHGMPPPVIRQIKGKQNLKPKPEYIPYVQDFVKSGKWSDVGDIRNADMWHNRKTGTFHTIEEGKNNPELMDEYGSRNIDAAGNPVPLNRRQAQGGPIRLADGGQPNLDTMRLALIQNGMYSPLEKAAFDVPRTKGTPQEFMAEVSKQPGFRKEELEDRPLNLPSGKMTKADFLKHLMANRGEPLIRTELGGERLDKIRDQLAKELVGEDYEGLNSSEQAEVDAEIKHQYGKMHPKYAEYQLPGGENYREVLLKLPGFSKKDQEQLMSFEASKRRHDPNDIKMHQFFDKEIAKLQNLKAKAGKQYQSSHWDDPNVIAHMRLSDRRGSNREKLLHLEELQSDWHQEGRKKGYKNQESVLQAKEALSNYEKDAKDRLRQIMLKKAEGEMSGERAIKFVNEYVDRTDAGAVASMLNEKKDYNNLIRAYTEAKKSPGVPNAPFKKSWHEMALKHALHEAATKGYHGIVITPGEEQANRYDLSKQVEAIRANLNPDGTYQLGVKPIGRNMQHHETSVSPDKLDAMVGKELAEKIRSGVTEPGVDSGKVFSGLDLKVGGEGMKGFYDKILPDYLNKLGKKHGAQVGQVDMRVGSPNETKPLHYFPITDSLRQQIKQEGLPLYKAGGSI